MLNLYFILYYCPAAVTLHVSTKCVLLLQCLQCFRSFDCFFEVTCAQRIRKHSLHDDSVSMPLQQKHVLSKSIQQNSCVVKVRYDLLTRCTNTHNDNIQQMSCYFLECKKMLQIVALAAFSTEWFLFQVSGFTCSLTALHRIRWAGSPERTPPRPW